MYSLCKFIKFYLYTLTCSIFVGRVGRGVGRSERVGDGVGVGLGGGTSLGDDDQRILKKGSKNT